MSVIDLDKVDGIGVDKKQSKIALMIADYLEWKDEYNHLKILQEKINSYISFIESKQVYEIYPKYSNIRNFIFDFRFKYKITVNCKLFLINIEKQLKEMNIEFLIKE